MAFDSIAVPARGDHEVPPYEEGRDERWLRNTPLLEHDHPKVRLHAARLAQLKRDERDKALACFRFVQSLRFRVASNPACVCARDVLAQGAGDWFTKATLMVSLLRALRIPARVRFVAIRRAHLHGLAGATECIASHPITEARLHGQWIATDAYAVDLRLREAASARLACEARQFGYMVRADGAADWDGIHGAFALFGHGEPACLPWTDLGAFDDVGHFRLHPGSIGCYPGRGALGTALINRKITRLRSAPAPARATAHAGLRI